MQFSDSFFARRFGLTERDLDRYLGEALSAGGDYADLYFEYLVTTSITVDESIVKSATQGTTLGLGIRVIAGERTGYAYTTRHVLFATTDGVLPLDPQPLERLGVSPYASKAARNPKTAYEGGGGR